MNNKSTELLYIPDEDLYQHHKKLNRERIVYALKIALLTTLFSAALYYFVFVDQSVRPKYVDEAAAPAFEESASEQLYSERFLAFMQKYGRDYESGEETMQRFQHYERKMREAAEFSKQKLYGADFGENDLSDWSDEEFKKTLLPLSFYKKLKEEATFIRNDPPKLERAAPLPDHFDWRARNAVTPVKAQGKCGSCWAFAATATVESAWIIAHGEARNLSEQTLLDCDMDDNACDGGDEDKAFRYIHRNGLAYAKDLPYVAHRQNNCHVGETTKIQTAYFLHQDENSIMDWVVNFGPVNIGMSVTQPMRAYKGGVFYPSEYACKNEVIGLHALLIVGYGHEKDANGTDQKYWWVKNSWGNTWGIDNGYIKFIRGVNACGIEDEPIGILA